MLNHLRPKLQVTWILLASKSSKLKAQLLIKLGTIVTYKA